MSPQLVNVSGNASIVETVHSNPLQCTIEFRDRIVDSLKSDQQALALAAPARGTPLREADEQLRLHPDHCERGTQVVTEIASGCFGSCREVEFGSVECHGKPSFTARNRSCRFPVYG
jgi:hypothetical protein